uniref:Uncharacterized protein n=1 Tax=Kwoniella pini CBS 10737 TaxID=1296096 RepID=A0A1B9I5U3_9TREE|nr:uncharacterized protein I206_02941 [Kwoniella pini CBS 10737]OCF50883.1 hypothetical protein I206_02941 [Kwoniella pini CBS 10737]
MPSCVPICFPTIRHNNRLTASGRPKVKVVMMTAIGSAHAAWSIALLSSVIIRAAQSNKLKLAQTEACNKPHEQWLRSNADVVTAVADCAPECKTCMKLNLISPAFLGKEYKEQTLSANIPALQIGPRILAHNENMLRLPLCDLENSLDRALEETGNNSVIYISLGIHL